MITDLMPAERYLSERVMRLELQRLWHRVWQCAGVARDVERIGDYFTYELGPETIVVVRSAQGLRAFHNICRHRGHPLCVAERGQLEEFSCPFHGWRYDLQGVLRSVPARETFPQILDLSEVRLAELAVEEWQGLIWIHFDRVAPPLTQFLGQLVSRLSAYDLPRYALVSDQTVEAPCNWKVSLESNSEDYHIPVLHPALQERFEDQVHRLALLGDHAVASSPSGADSLSSASPRQLGGMLGRVMSEVGLDAQSASMTPSEARTAIRRAFRSRTDIDVSRLTDDELTDFHHYAVFPNLGLNLSVATLILQRHRPHADLPGWSYFDQQVFERIPLGATAPKRPPHQAFRFGNGTLGPVSDQDVATGVAIQRNLASGGFQGVILGEREELITHLLKTIDRYLGEPRE